MSSSKVILGYFFNRGKAGALRNLLAYCNVPFQNKLYPDSKEWFNKDKHTLGFDYPNLPYLIDGDKKITETYAILHYIPIRANRRDLIGDTDDKFIQVQTALNVVRDIREILGQLIWTQRDFIAEKEKAFQEKGIVRTKLEVLDKKLENREYLCGFISIADFQLSESLDIIQEIEPEMLEKYPNLNNFQKRFLELPQMKNFLRSEEFIKTWLPEWNKTQSRRG